MTTGYIILGVTYMIGIFFTMAVEKTLPDEMKNYSKVVHNSALFFIWLISPILMVYIVVKLAKFKRK